MTFSRQTPVISFASGARVGRVPLHQVVVTPYCGGETLVLDSKLPQVFRQTGDIRTAAFGKRLHVRHDDLPELTFDNRLAKPITQRQHVGYGELRAFRLDAI
jgi:hypothetical protein